MTDRPSYAELIKSVEYSRQENRHYLLSEPLVLLGGVGENGERKLLRKTRTVAVSKTYEPEEVLAFWVDGDSVEYGQELPGSIYGPGTHEQVLANLGYEALEGGDA